jgi:hypothetical protein
MFKDFYKSNPRTKEMPKVNYPITIVYEDGTTKTIASEDLLAEAYEDCWEDWADDWKDDADSTWNDWKDKLDSTWSDWKDKSDSTWKDWGKDWDRDWKGGSMDELCFEIVYPISVKMPDGTTVSGNDEDAIKTAIDTWYKNNPDVRGQYELVFPITLDYGADSTGTNVTKVVNNMDEYITAMWDCFGDWDTDWDKDWNRGWAMDSLCFEVVYPVSAKMSDDTIITGNTEEEFENALAAWRESNPDKCGYAEIQFPITINYGPDSTGTDETKVLNSMDELWIAMGDCYDYPGDKDWDKDWDFNEDTYDLCFELVYPISYEMPDGSVISGNDEDALKAAIKTWRTNNPDVRGNVKMVFPVTLNYGPDSTGTDVTKVVNNMDEYYQAIVDCYVDIDDNDWDEWNNGWERDWRGMDSLCFEIVFPISVKMVDGTILTGADEDALIAAIEAWKTNNPDKRAYSEIVFPITLNYGPDENGTDITKVINDMQEYHEAIWDCFGDWDKDDDWEDDWSVGYGNWGMFQGACFDFQYPLSLMMADSTTITASSEDSLNVKLKKWYKDNRGYSRAASIVFPVTIVYEDGTTVAIDDEEDLWEAYEDCFDDMWEDCFEIVFPVSVEMPDGSVITANDEDAMEEAIEDWYKNNPNTREEPKLIFPIQIEYTDGTIVTIADEDELDEAWEDCYGWDYDDDYDDDKDWDNGDYDVCFELVYPISIKVSDGTTVSGNNEEELIMALMEWLTDNPNASGSIEFVFPVTVEYANGNRETFYTDDELQEAWKDCYGDDEDEDNSDDDDNSNEGKIGPGAFLSVTDNVFTNTAVFPNPASETVTIEFASTLAGKATMTLVDAKGHSVMTKEITTSTGENSLQINVNEVTSGRYFIRIINANGTATIPVTVVK